MQPIHLETTAQADGQLLLTGLPIKKGDRLEVTVQRRKSRTSKQKDGTAADLLQSGLIGIWEARTDIEDSLEYARGLRRQAELRQDRR